MVTLPRRTLWVGTTSGGRFAVYKRYVVHLTDQERSQLQRLVRRGRAHARKLLYARILLKADADGPDRWTDERIAQAFEVSAATVARERRRFCEDGLEVALMPRKPGRPRRKVLDGRAEAHLLALACSDAPEGRERWSMRLLADRMVELGHVDSVSYETVRRTLKKTSSNLTSSASG
jgi:transposase